MFFHPLCTTVLLVLVAVAAGIGTFVESAHGPLAAHAGIYGSWWFVALLTLVAVQLIGVMIPRRGWNSLFIMHGSLVLLLLGGAVSMLISQRGTIELRHGDSTDHYWSHERYLQFDDQLAAFDPHAWAGTASIADIHIRADRAAGEHAVVLHCGTETHQLSVAPGPPTTITTADGRQVTYGSLPVALPFQLGLDQFIMTTYPGSDVPATFASQVQINGQVHHIRMNEPFRSGFLKVFQTGYTPDRQGSILTVNWDPGAPIFYLGCVLLFASLLVTLVRSGSRFGQLRQHLSAGLLLLSAGGLLATEQATESYGTRFADATRTAADTFGRLTVQAPTGRTQPLDTLNREILRKIHRAESWQGLTANQVVIGLLTRPEQWQHAALIAVGKPAVRDALGTDERHLALVDFFTDAGDYRLRDWLTTAHATPPFEQSTFDREVIKVDERVQILRQVIDGGILQIMPTPGASAQPWQTARTFWRQVDDLAIEKGLRQFFDGGFDLDPERLQAGVETIRTYQATHGAQHVIAGWRLDLELAANTWRILPRLTPLLAGSGVILFVLALVLIGRDRSPPRWLCQTAVGTVATCFALTTAGIIVRWLVAGTPPLTNTYENMIYIAWSALLASLIMLRGQLVGLAGGLLLAGFFFLGAHLNHLDPEITTLVPVLQSFWLLVHVTVITASYGFLGLCACIGLGTLGLTVCRPRLPHATLVRLATVNELTMTLGLVLLVIGTFLGAIWASESWGRYWAWDPKETWALISILVYVIITHLRLVPRCDHPLIMATGSLWAYASILMTYYGVNFYLTGLHAYATGSPAPIPAWVIFTVILLALLTFTAWLRRPPTPVELTDKMHQDITAGTP